MGVRMIYTCKDGHVTSMLGGLVGVRQLLGWMLEEGSAPEWLTAFDWESTDFRTLGQTPEGREFFSKVGGALNDFFASHTKAELYEGALTRRLLIAPVNTVADIRTDAQLEFRGYFQEVDGVAYPGPWAKLSATPIEDTPRAPRIGEHTAEVLGLDPATLRSLSAAGVI